MKKLQICEFVGSLSSGGAENFVRLISHCLNEKGHDVIVLLLKKVNQDSPYEQAAVKELTSAGITVVSLGLTQRFGHSICLLFSSLHFFLHHDFDVVHSHCEREDFLSVFCKIFLFKKYKCVGTLHNSVISRKGIRSRIRCYLHRHIIHSVFCGKEAYEANRTSYPKSIYIANGVDVSMKQIPSVDLGNAESLHPILFAVGRLTAQKNQMTMLKAMPHVIQKHPNCGLLICGKGDLEEELQKKIEDLGLEKNVRLLGERSDVPSLLHRADFFVSTSSYEGLPIAVLEACAHRVPALLSPIPPHLALAEKIHCCFCAKDFSPEAFSDLILFSVEHNVSEKITNEMWNQDLKEYSIERCCERYIDFFQKSI